MLTYVRTHTTTPMNTELSLCEYVCREIEIKTFSVTTSRFKQISFEKVKELHKVPNICGLLAS